MLEYLKTLVVLISITIVCIPTSIGLNKFNIPVLPLPISRADFKAHSGALDPIFSKNLSF